MGPVRAGDATRPGAHVIEFHDVGKTYRSVVGRSVRAVDGLTLAVGRGEVVGLAGPNGAGKSTLIALMLGFLRPTDGAVTIDRMPPRAFIERRGVGYLSELVAIPPRWRADEALRRYALLAGLDDGAIDSRIEQLLAQLGLDEHRDKKVKALSKGTLQRLGLAQALLRDEEAVVLDEPTHGLDPLWTVRFRDIVAELRRDDRAILIASHNLDELQRVADRVAIIDRGRLQRVVSTRTVPGAGERTAYRIALAAGAEQVARVFPQAQALGGGEFLLPALDLPALNAGLATLLAAGGVIAAVLPAHTSLEREFREAVGGGEGS